MAKMLPPKSGVKIRMYRQGHGDCFLLACKKEDGSPFYMLIDCGVWNGSQVDDELTIDKIVASIEEATGGAIDVLLITHEHEDHVNGFGATDDAGEDCWRNISIGEVWLAWTEDGSDAEANAIRKRFNDTLVALTNIAVSPLAASHDRDERLELVRELVALHSGETDISKLAISLGDLGASGARTKSSEDKIKGISNKRLMKKMRVCAENGVRFLDPKSKKPNSHSSIPSLKFFVLGPPRKLELLLSLNPKSKEEFKVGIDRSSEALARAFSADPDDVVASRPFNPRYGTPISHLAQGSSTYSSFFEKHHGFKDKKAGGEEWRRIDDDWLDTAEALAMRLNNEVNNTSLVIAIQLPNTEKVLLFSGDAQRGNWISWSDLSWEQDDGQELTAKELLGRTVFYKVGHHGSHNATLNGDSSSPHANLGWFGLGEYADEFTAMIPANKEWAYGKSQVWKHPLKSIEEALIEKASGRVFRTDERKGPKKPKSVSKAVWDEFQDKASFEDLFFEYSVLDE